MVLRNAPQETPRAEVQYDQRNEQETRDIIGSALDQLRRDLRQYVDAIETEIPEFVLEQFGGINDGLEASAARNDLAFERALDRIRDSAYGGTIRFLPGAGYVLAEEHNAYVGLKSLRIKWDNGSRVFTNLLGADKVLFDFTNPDTPSTRGGGVVLDTPRVQFHPDVSSSAIGCVFFQCRYATDFHIVGNYGSILHYHYNTALRLSGTWNCNIGPVAIWGAGFRKPRKSTGTTTFSITQGDNTLQASSSVFDSSDEGDIIVVGSEMFTIDTVTDGDTAEVLEAAFFGHASERASYGAVRCDTTATSATVTLESNVAAASDVGRVVYILDGEDLTSAKQMFRAVITAAPAPNQYTLSAAVPETLTSAEIIISPAVEVYYDTGAFDGQPNDIVFDGLQCESFRGSGIMLGGGTNIFLKACKAHCVNGSYNDDASDYNLIANYASVIFDGDLEGVSCGRLARVLVAGAYDMVDIGPIKGIGVENQRLVHAHNMFAGAEVSIGNWSLANQVSAKTLTRAYDITGDGVIRQRTGTRTTSLNTDFSFYPDLLGSSSVRPAQAMLPAGSRAFIGTNDTLEAPSYVASGVLSPGEFTGIGVDGSMESPEPTADFQPLALFSGQAISPNGTLQRVAAVQVEARNPSTGVVEGVVVIYTRNSSGTWAARWMFTAAGEILPFADGTQSIGWSGGRVGNYHGWGMFLYGLVDAADDTAAAGAGVSVNQIYRNGSQLMMRVS